MENDMLSLTSIRAIRTVRATPRVFACTRPARLLALTAVLSALALPFMVRAEFANPQGVAVIIGNADYEHRDVPDVTFAHRDADAFRGYVVEVLGYDPENVVDLRDATRRELFDALGTKSDPRSLLWSYLDPVGGSDVVVFYSGHGVPGVNDGRGYLLPVDADPKAAEDDGYPIDLLYRNVGGLEEARSVRVYLDACFSGGSNEGGLIRNASPVYVEATLPEGVGDKVTSLTAASGKQVASWDENARHGLFTHHLLNALYGAWRRERRRGGHGGGGEGIPRSSHDAGGTPPAPAHSGGKSDWGEGCGARGCGGRRGVSGPARKRRCRNGLPRSGDGDRAGGGGGRGRRGGTSATRRNGGVGGVGARPHPCAARSRAAWPRVARRGGRLAPDGIFGERTRAGISSLQKKKGLAGDGLSDR